MRFHYSPGKLIALLLPAVLFFVVGGWLVKDMPDQRAQLGGWGSLLLGSAVFILLVWRLLTQLGKPIVTIDDEGIFDARLKMGVIPWNRIRSISVLKVRSTRFLAIEPIDGGLQPRSALAHMNASLGYPLISINFSGLSPGFEAAWDFVQHRYTGPAQASARARRGLAPLPSERIEPRF